LICAGVLKKDSEILSSNPRVKVRFVMAKVELDSKQVKKVKQIAAQIAQDIQCEIEKYSTESVERTVLRLYGVDGVNSEATPLANRIVELAREQIGLENGISKPFAAAMLETGRDAQMTAELIEKGELSFAKLKAKTGQAIDNKEAELGAQAIAVLDNTRRRKLEKQQKTPVPMQPWRYLIVATGNIYEDRVQAKAAVHGGADIIAVIRSTAQSLLDYVPYGATTEGFGGTYATQENFKIVRKALDEAAKETGRYVRLVNYSSGLCMAEIAACAALEDLDMLLNDSMYGILFRDINMKRTFVDQYLSRLICSRAKIIINTGEDNYLTTADAVDNAHTVVASDLINEAMAQKALLTEDMMGLGHAFEVDPKIKNSFLYELAQAQLIRQLFPNAPLKYMPPTKHKSTDIFFSHALDTMFNLASVTTNQGIHLTGILTEAIHTPLMQDRYKAISSVNYVFNSARDFSDEIEFRKDGFVAGRVKETMDKVEGLLSKIEKMGLMKALADGVFADIARPIDGGKGFDGVFAKGPNYSNPIIEILEKDGVIKEEN
jgi:beta-lysine 5,6-aminomutase alpha subunit